MEKHLVFVGGGHAHLLSLKNLAHFKSLGHRVTLVSSSPYHYYSGMGPGMLSGIYHPREARFHIKKLAEDRGAAFIEGKAVKVDPVSALFFWNPARRSITTSRPSIRGATFPSRGWSQNLKIIYFP